MRSIRRFSSTSVRLTKSRKVSVKNRAQIVANMFRGHGYAFAIDGYELLIDGLLPFVSLTHRGRLRYWLPLAAVLSQSWAHLGWFLAPQKHQCFALSLPMKALSEPWAPLGRFLRAQKRQRSALLLSVKSAVRRVVLWESLLGTK
jgi:hypothetical protein